MCFFLRQKIGDVFMIHPVDENWMLVLVSVHIYCAVLGTFYGCVLHIYAYNYCKWKPKNMQTREWHGDRCLTPLLLRKICSCPRPQPVPSPFAAFCPHPRRVTARVIPIPTPLPQSRANKNTSFPGVEKTMDIIFWHFVRMFWDFIWIYVDSFYFLHFVCNVIVLLIFNIAAFT